MRIENECEWRRSVSREEVREEKIARREGVRVERECQERRSVSREGVRGEKE